MNLGALFANLAWTAGNVAPYLRYRKALGSVQEAQWSILSSYLRRNADTVFGRAHSFSAIRNVAEFQARVPLLTYDDYATYVDRIARGEQHVLTREPVTLLQPSSGSTRAAKLIPFTASLQKEFASAVAAWVMDLFRRWPSLVGGPAYWLITPPSARPNTDNGALPIAFQEDRQYLGARVSRLLTHILAVPGIVSAIPDPELHRRVTLVYLMRCRGLRLISVWHPTFLTLLLGTLRDRWNELLTDIHDGLRLRDPVISIPPSTTRARELGRLNPEDAQAIWPRLRIISCWADGSAARYVRPVQERFPQVTVQGKGLIATEAFVSLPYRGQRPLAVTSHFFEFLDGGDLPHCAWNLEIGATYSLVITTGGGLYRYRLHDLVEVTGFIGSTPCLRFVAKEDLISDLRGEKLSQGFVGDVVDRQLADRGLRPSFVMLAPEEQGDQAGYVLFLATPDAPPPELAAALDNALRQNPNYEHCIATGQLLPVRVAWCRGDAYARYTVRLAQNEQRVGNIKPTPLSALTGWSEALGVQLLPAKEGPCVSHR